MKASTDDDLVEVTSQTCGITGYKDTTVKLTREQFQDFEEYLVEFRAQLNQTSTKEEAVPIFKEAVVELDNYGLLPRGMSVERAQRFIVSMHENDFCNSFLKRIIYTYPDNSSDSINNYLCLVTGRVNEVQYVNIILTLGIPPLIRIYALYGFFAMINHATNLFKLVTTFLYHIQDLLFYLMNGYWNYLMSNQPCFFGCNVAFKGRVGWVHTIGLNGIKKINGTLYGEIPYLMKWMRETFFPQAIKYFVGFRINDNSDEDFLIGSALRVNIGLE